MTPVLQAVHLKKDFPLRAIRLFGPAQAVHAVEDTSLALYPGKATALVGESGSGKTTVARLLGRLHEPTSGEIRFCGESVGNSHQSLRAYRRQVQYIFQDPFSSLNPAHGVRYHLARSLRLYGSAHNPNEECEQILALLERVNLTPADHFVDKFPHQLSGGQRQRVAIARYFAEETLVMYAGQMVEGGLTEEMIQHPRHPYSQLLLSAAPDPDTMGHRQAAEVAIDRRTGTKARVNMGEAISSVRGEPPS